MIEKKCPHCDRMIKGWNKKMLDYNMQSHIENKHKKDTKSTSEVSSTTKTSFFSGSSKTTNSGGASNHKEVGK